MTDAPVPPVIAFPSRLDRRSRVGPFPHARAALRFLTLVAVGAALAVVLGPLAWVPFLGGGFLLTVSRGDSKTVDERLGDVLRWELRRRRTSQKPVAPTGWTRETRFARVPSGRIVAGIAGSGVPVAFLPPADARSLFEEYRELLRSDEGPLYLRVASVPIRSAPFRLARVTTGPPMLAPARSGYDSMVRLLLRRRRRRVVHLFLWSPTSASPDSRALDARGENLVARLRALGVDAVRLEGIELWRAVRAAGWAPGEAA
ncbi:MAG TPA: hypothetical protein VEY07_08200 [Thermoplasmata archaeon]|nr:hypothetical protein [Thermoplasmata archaeon]